MKLKLAYEQDLPAGTYWVTDPCYAYPEKEWGTFCNHLTHTPGYYTYGDTAFYVWGTAHGDGVYRLKGPTEGDCCVDAGLLSIIPESLTLKWQKRNQDELARLGVKITISEPFIITENEGDVKFGKYRLKTS